MKHDDARKDMPRRCAERQRKTNESDITVAVDIDGSGEVNILTGLPFFDHMLSQLGKHGRLDLADRGARRPRRRRPPQRRGHGDRLRSSTERRLR